MAYELKTIECVNALLKDLYIDLRRKVNYWSTLTDQTPQAKMGYIGQHLVSAVTGYKGGKSGARGKDLIISDTEYAEIKTCTKVDQLGFCVDCKMPVSPIETVCSFCGSTNIERKDDSKWLINITEETPNDSTLEDSEDVLTNIAKPKYYFFVLFEFENIRDHDSPIIITIYQVDPKQNGFVLCMLDYYYNLGHKTAFNMWPHMLKFSLCHPKIIYQSKIHPDNTIETLIFSPDNPVDVPFDNLRQYSRSKNLKENARNILKEYGIDLDSAPTTEEILQAIDDFCKEYEMSNEKKISTFANGFYREPIQKADEKLKTEGREIPSVFNEFVDPLKR